MQEKRIGAYGVSVERTDEALAAIARPNVASVQIILNALRLKPLDQVLPAAAAAGVGIIARVPLASGLLSGRYDENTTFADDDHRNYNRHGEAFDVGETFSGVDFETGLEAVRRLRPLVPAGASMAQFALRWVLDQPRRHRRHPGRPQPGTGPGERGRRRAAAAACAHSGRCAGNLRRADPSPDPRQVVSPMRGWLSMVLGLLTLVLGAVWTLQGLSVLDDSVMSGVQIWAVIGPVVAVIGLVLIVTGLRRRNHAKRAELAALPVTDDPGQPGRRRRPRRPGRRPQPRKSRSPASQ